MAKKSNCISSGKLKSSLAKFQPAEEASEAPQPSLFTAEAFAPQIRATVLAMSTNSKKPILWSLVFAVAMIASAFLFKGNPALYWIEAGLMVAALTFAVLKSQRPVCAR